MEDQKLIFSSMTRVNSVELDEEYNNELKNLLLDVREINHINLHMNELISSQSEKINIIAKNTDKTINNIEASNGQLILASDYQKSIFLKKSILLTLCTAIITTPVSILIGGYTAVATGIGTFVAGGVALFG